MLGLVKSVVKSARVQMVQLYLIYTQKYFLLQICMSNMPDHCAHIRTHTGQFARKFFQISSK